LFRKNQLTFIMTSFIATSLAAQPARFQTGVYVTGEVRLSNGSFADSLYAELYDTQRHSIVARSVVSGGRFDFPQVVPGLYTIRLAKAFGDAPLLEEPHQVGEDGSSFLTLVLPSSAQERPPIGAVSVREFRHPIPQKAIRAAHDAQRFSQSGDTHRAIVKLQEAVRIAPAYRDAHVNLGVEYARAGRIEDAIHEFNEALEIGPPVSVIYTNLALALSSLRRFREASAAASKALALNPSDSAASKLLAYANEHQ